MKPGGPYSIAITYSGYEKFAKENLFLDFSSSGNFYNAANNVVAQFILSKKTSLLKEVIVNAKMGNKSNFGIESSINSRQISSLPSISRNLQDFVKLIPQAKVNGDGMMSFAGQNNKYNAFFIDGSNTNDMLGIANNGSAGGRTDASPISMEAIEEIKVLQSPYDVQYSNFTGASINAITKSGTNQFKSSAWYFFSNEKMAGKFEDKKLDHFSNQTAGIKNDKRTVR